MTVTPRQRQVAQLLAQGMTRQQIARTMHMSASGVDKHLDRLNREIGAINSTNAVAILITEGVIQYERGQ